jgi:hypothetical protein
MCQLNIRRLLRPGKRQCLAYVPSSVLLHKGDEIEQSLARIMQLESESASHLQIFLRGLP